MNDEAKNLESMIQYVIAKPEYQPGYPNWHEWHDLGYPKQPGASKTTTWCNEAANDVLVRMGFDTAPILNVKGIGWTGAKDMHYNAVAMSLSAPSGVFEITGRRAQAWANMGIPVLAAAVAKTGPSHVGIVAPTDAPFSLSAGPWIGQAGAVNGFRSAFDSFQKWGLSAPRYFLLPPKTA